MTVAVDGAAVTNSVAADGAAAADAGPGRARTVRGAARERGQVAVEFIGFVPILLLVAFAAIQLGVVAHTVSQAGTAARAAARTASYEEADADPAAAGRAAVSSWLADGTSIGIGGGDEEAIATATVTIPSLIPGVGDFGTVTKRATMPRD
ncbi:MULTISPECIES: TadE family protein [Streptomyces]|uniref:Pilus assembly protein n=1 Tax=Streptomyces xinghaiensis TaxID=1038928 RepID=A0A3R7EQ44_9ACTN|nr:MULTISPECIES: TadE family protein [Streptomyces]PQM20263.1 pilus assembly protein [Streptomyces xinghaiensis]RKM93966.1 pilus assembly protein [Streptomyces xinghaiensis]RNC69469.1 pilus assembly protein [Streptomyces xinghaiensis]